MGDHVLRVTFTVDFATDWLPSPSDEDASLALLEDLMDVAPETVRRVHMPELEAVGWRVDAGVYGDLGTGMAPDRPTGPRAPFAPFGTEETP